MEELAKKVGDICECWLCSRWLKRTIWAVLAFAVIYFGRIFY